MAHLVIYCQKIVVTLFPGEGNDISSTLAHHFGDIERTVGLIGYGDRAVDSLSLHLQINT